MPQVLNIWVGKHVHAKVEILFFRYINTKRYMYISIAGDIKMICLSNIS